MKRYYKMMLGKGNEFLPQSLKEGFIGVDFDFMFDLSKDLFDNWRDFNKKYIPVFLKIHPEKSRVAAGLGCGATWTVCKGINVGDIVIVNNGQGSYHIAEVIGGYYYKENDVLFHRRNVKWLDKTILKSSMSDELQASLRSIGTISVLDNYAEELNRLIDYTAPPDIRMTGQEVIEDPYIFALEKHLEEFMVQNWKIISLSEKYDIFEDEGQKVGQQYQTDTGAIDILAVSKDKKEIAVIELKRGRTNDVVLGQVQRYMGYVLDELSEPNQTVKGIIIAFEDDIKLRRALKVTNNIELYTYKVSFKLEKVV